MAQITITIPDDKMADFLKGFYKVNPKPNDVSQADWIKKCITDYLTRQYIMGKKDLARDTVQNDLILN